MTSIVTPAGARKCWSLPATTQPRRVYQLEDGRCIRVDDHGQVDEVYQGGRPHPGIASLPDAGGPA